MKRKIGIVIMVTLLACALFLGCTQKPTESAEAASDGGAFNGSTDQKYYMNVFLPGAEFWKGCWEGFQAAADQLGVTIEFTGPTNYDAAEQVETFEQILAQNPAGILVCPLDEDSLRVPVQRALDMGIPVATFFIDVSGTNRLSNLGPSPEAEGAAVAYNLAEMIGGSGNIGIITRPQDNVARRIVEFERIIAKEFPNIKIVQSVYAESDTTVATEMASAMLQANPNLKAIIPFAALEAIGVAQAKKETGLDFKIITVETDPGVLDLIRDGLINGTVGQDTYSPAYFALINLYIAKNKLCRPYTDWQKNPWSPLPEQVAFPTAFITKENADLFEPPTW